MKVGRIFTLWIMTVLGAPGIFAQTASRAAPPHYGSDTKDTAAPLTERSERGRAVFIDPETGRVRQPDAAEIGRLLPPPAAKAAVAPPVTTKTGPGGAVGVVLDSSYDSSLVARKKPDGKVVVDCVTGDDNASATLPASGKTADEAESHRTLDVR